MKFIIIDYILWRASIAAAIISAPLVRFSPWIFGVAWSYEFFLCVFQGFRKIIIVPKIEKNKTHRVHKSVIEKFLNPYLFIKLHLYSFFAPFWSLRHRRVFAKSSTEIRNIIILKDRQHIFIENGFFGSFL